MTNARTTLTLWCGVLLPICTIRIAIMGPTASYWVDAVKHKDLIQGHVELHNGTYNTAILTAVEIGARWGFPAFIWTMVVFFPGVLFLPPLNFPFVVVDTIIAIFYATSTHYQTGFTTNRKADCHGSNVHDIQRPAGVNESFFEAAARLNGTRWRSSEMCEDFVDHWRFGLALSILCSCISFIGIVSFLRAISNERKQNKDFHEMLKSCFSGKALGISVMGKGLGWMFATFLYYLPRSLFRCLPISVKAPVRAGRRYAAKARVGAEQKTGTVMLQLKEDIAKNWNAPGKYQGVAGEQTPLAQFLGVYDMLILVTEHLHYVEVMNLSYVSKSVRQSVLPSQDRSRRLAVFKRYTCKSKDKAPCWTCNNQTCSGCQRRPWVWQTNILHHRDRCRPICTPCYNTHVLRSKAQKRPSLFHSIQPWCECAPVSPRSSNFFLRWLKGSEYYARTQSSLAGGYDKPVCRQCSGMSDNELASLGEEKTKRLLKRGLNADGVKWTKCYNLECGRELGTGPRWWVCRNRRCGKECTDSIHGAWGRRWKEDGNDAYVGGEAV